MPPLLQGLLVRMPLLSDLISLVVASMLINGDAYAYVKAKLTKVNLEQF